MVPQPAKPHEQSSTGRPARVLVVDDDVSICRVLTLLLRLHGYDAEAVDSAAAARQSLADGGYDVALIDKELGDGCGMQLASELNERILQGRIIIMTGGELPPFARTIRKPFRYGELLALVRELTLPVEPATPPSFVESVAS